MCVVDMTHHWGDVIFEINLRGKGDHRKREREVLVNAKWTQGESWMVATPSIIAIS